VEENLIVTRYNEFISMIELKGIDIDSLNCKKNSEFEKEDVVLDIAMDFEVEEGTQEGLEIKFPFVFRLKAFKNDTKEQKVIDSIKDEDTLFNIDLSFQVSYFLRFPKTSKNENIVVEYSDILETFAERNVSINVWPYAREIVSDLTSKMGFPRLLIPLKKSQSF
jgi:preprotein translocase subunit SecB